MSSAITKEPFSVLARAIQFPVGPTGFFAVQLSKKAANEGAIASPAAARIPVEMNPLLDVDMVLVFALCINIWDSKVQANRSMQKNMYESLKSSLNNTADKIGASNKGYVDHG